MKLIMMIPLVCCSIVLSHLAYAQSGNPLLNDYNTPFDVPPFNKINDSHFKPALEAAMVEQNQMIEEIVNEPNPTFENTYEKFEKSWHKLNHISSIFDNLLSANTNDYLQELAREMKPILSEHEDDIYSNEALFNIFLGRTVEDVESFAGERAEIVRLKERYEENQDESLAREIEEKSERLRNEMRGGASGSGSTGSIDFSSTTPEQRYLLTEVQKKFVRRGAQLSEGDKSRLKEINSRLAYLSVQFGDNVLQDINDYKLVITDKNDLSGLPETVVEAAKERAKDMKIKGWVFTLSPPSLQPFLQYADNRELRQEIMEAHLSKGNSHSDRMNGPILKEMVELRHEKAQMLGYNTHAHYVLQESMAKTPDRVMDLLNQLWTPALKMAEDEAKAIQELIDKEGGKFDLQPWDWAYYTEKIRKKKYDLDAEALRPYFELDNVINGFFMLSDRLWGLKFTPLKNVPVYHEDVRAYEVTETNGDHIGVIYMDFFPRSSKRGGAWMSSFRKQSTDEQGNRIAPVITIVCNFSPPSKKEPSLLTLREVETFYHEMGHALHGLLSNVKYQMFAGTSVSRDFVELPSQLMENWVLDGRMVKRTAKHYKTGETIPKSLIDKVEESRLFNMGFKTVEYLAASYLDMRYHSEPSSVAADHEMVEFMTQTRLKLPSYIPFRYKSTYFNHIFAGGYSAGYYSYIWSEVLDADTFAAFEKTGNTLDRNTAQRFREIILERGGSAPADQLYSEFRGRATPALAPLLQRRGLQ